MNILIQKYGLKYSTLVPDLYGLMQRILYIISITPYFNITVPLVKQYVITKGPLYGVLHLYALWLRSMTLAPTL